jgi:von Hippel-Lindau disease tumor supressor
MNLIMSRSNRLWLLISIVSTFATFIAVPVLAQRRHPTEAAGMRSINGDFSTSVKFINNSLITVKVYWLDYDGNRKFYKSLQAGEQYIQQTYLTHPWLITDTRNNSLYLFFPDAQARTVDIR